MNIFEINFDMLKGRQDDIDLIIRNMEFIYVSGFEDDELDAYFDTHVTPSSILKIPRIVRHFASIGAKTEIYSRDIKLALVIRVTRILH